MPVDEDQSGGHRESRAVTARGEGGATGHLLGSLCHGTSFVTVPSDGMFGEEGKELSRCFPCLQSSKLRVRRNYTERFHRLLGRHVLRQALNTHIQPYGTYARSGVAC